MIDGKNGHLREGAAAAAEVSGERGKEGGSGGGRRRFRGIGEFNSLNKFFELPVINERIFPFRNELSFQLLRELYHFVSFLFGDFVCFNALSLSLSLLK